VFYKFTLYTLFISILLSGCSASKQQQPTLISDKKPISTNPYRSQSGFYFVLIEKNDDIWKIVDIKDRAIEKRAKKNQEILKIDESYSQVRPYFTNKMDENTSNIYKCSKTNDANIYSPCTSTLVKPVDDGGIFNFLKNFYSSSPINKHVDKKLIDKISRETKLFEAIESKKDIFAYIECERSFRRASNIDEFNAVIQMCSSLEDANRLVKLSIQNRDAMVERKRVEDEERRVQEEKSELRDKIKLQRLEKETNTLEQMERRAMHNFTKNLEKFRKSLKEGAETNCGKIIEMKNSAAKVHFPLKNYGDEHWIDLNKIFPKGHGCRFVKGKYIAPATF
jgi:hypothetical protein